MVTLDLYGNVLETLSYNTVLPLMDNLVNNTHSTILLSGEYWTHLVVSVAELYAIN